MRIALERSLRGSATLVISHRLAAVQKPDRIIVMDGDRIVAQGSRTDMRHRRPVLGVRKVQLAA